MHHAVMCIRGSRSSVRKPVRYDRALATAESRIEESNISRP